MITLNQFNRVRDAARRNIQLKPRLWKTETTPEYEGHSNISLVHTKIKYLLNISFDEYHRIIGKINKNITHISLYSLFRCYGHLCINMIGS